MIFEAKDICAGYYGTDILSEISFSLNSGDVLCLLGPNGVGKTTLFKSLLGFLPLTRGQIFLDGQVLRHDDYKKQAAMIGYVPQVHEPPFPFQVLDVVVMGSIARLSLFSGPSRSAYKKAADILEILGVAYLADKVYTEISGGERQMVLIARALMQEPQFLMMDEPTSNLDFGNQMRVLQQICMLAGQGMGIIMTSHFPDHAFLCCNKAALMCKDTSFKVGSVQEIVTERALLKAYGIKVKIADVNVEEDSWGVVKTCLPIMRTVSMIGKRVSCDESAC